MEDLKNCGCGTGGGGAGAADGGHSSGEHSCGMAMWFHTGHNEKVLFEEWFVETPTHMAWSVVAIVIAGIIFEGLKYYREYLFVNQRKNASSKSTVIGACHLNPPPVPQPKMMTAMHFYQTLLHAIQVTLGFLLMLITMTYNYWLFLAVVIGGTIGHFLFGWKKSSACDPNESCH